MEPKNPIIIDGLSCDNCPEFKRCQEQQTKKEYAINQVLQDIPSEYANIIDRLKQIIPSITRCDYVLEKQLKRKEQECDKLYIQLKADEEYHKEEENTLRKIIKNKEERNIELYKENNKLKQTLTEIKEIAENVQSFVGRINIEDDVFEQMEQILQKISEMNHDL